MKPDYSHLARLQAAGRSKRFTNPQEALREVRQSLVPPWTQSFRLENLSSDIKAGILGAMLMFPQAMAYAVIAGLPPIYGIYCAIVPATLAAFFGSSNHLISGPTAALSLFIFAVCSPLATPGSPEYIGIVMLLTLMAGTIQFSLGFFRLGSIVNFVSDSVIIGFTTGAGILIAASQLSNLLGVDKGAASSFIEFLTINALNLGETNLYALFVGIVSITMTILTKYIPLVRQIPSLVVGIVSGSSVAVLLNIVLGTETTGLIPNEPITSVIPPIKSPQFDGNLFWELIPAALALTMLGLIEAMLIARSIGLKSGQIIDANREFTAQGISNLVGAFCSSYASSGSFTRSGANYDAGAKTPLAAIIGSALVLVIGILFAPLTSYLFKPVLAGSLMVIAYRLIEYRDIKALHQRSPSASVVMWVSLLSALFIGLEFAIFAGAGLSLLFYLERVSNPQLHFARASKRQYHYHFLYSKRPTDCPQLVILFIDGSIFFGAAANLHQKIQRVRNELPDRKHFLFLCGGVNHLDIHGSDVLRRLTEEQRALGGDVYFHNMKSEPIRLMVQTGDFKAIGRNNFYTASPGTLTDIYRRMDNNICASCHEHAFRICKIKAGMMAREESSLEEGAVMRET